MWGTLASSSSERSTYWFIPTHVGNSAKRQIAYLCRLVHPHACGELMSVSCFVPSVNGSSPRMWGTPKIRESLQDAEWFIPTHVGNSIYVRKSSASTLVHPHACGELIFVVCVAVIVLGSSPRMWGTPRATRVTWPDRWFIPTHVGNSKVWMIFLFLHLVHPHACGELVSMNASRSFAVGSSPRMWGTRCFLKSSAH